MKPIFVKCGECQCTVTERGFTSGTFCMRTPNKIKVNVEISSIGSPCGCWMGIPKEEIV